MPKIHPTPSKAGFYWAKWKIIDPATHEASDLKPSNSWEVVDVFENHIKDDDHEKWRVHVSGVREGQPIENFFWGPGPLPEPNGE